MVNDDSLSDDESFFDVYSAKNTTSAYNSFLEKIKAEYDASQKEKPDTEEDDEVIVITSDATSSGSSTSEREAAGGSSDSEITSNNSSASPPNVRNPFVQRTTRLNRQRNRRPSIEILEEISGVSRRRTRQRRPVQTTPEIIEVTNKEMEVLPGDLYVEEYSNYEVLVKVLWKSVNIKTFHLKRFQKFTEVFEYFMRTENVPYEKILLQVGDTKISIRDSPETLNLKVCDFIEGGVLSDAVVPQNQIPVIEKSHGSKRPIDENHLTVKIQGEHKGFHKFSMHKKDNFQNVMVKYADKVEAPLKKIKFYYDGDILNSSDTPGFVGMEDDEIIDAVLLK